MPNFHTELCCGEDYWGIFQVQIWLVKFVFCQPIRFKTRANGQTFQFGKIQNSKVCLPWKAEAEKVAIINKIASALTVCVEVSEACQTKLMKKSAYFLDNTLTAQTTYFDFKFRKVISSFFKNLVKTALCATSNSFQAFSKMINLSDATVSMWMIYQSVNSVIDLDCNFLIDQKPMLAQQAIRWGEQIYKVNAWISPNFQNL